MKGHGPTGASDEILRLRTELAAARQHAGDAEQKALEKEAENGRIKAANADLRARNAHLELMNELMRRDKFGASSERRRRLIDQMELELEDLEADATGAEMEAAYAAAKTTTVKAFTRARSTRRDFHPDLPRERVVLAAPTQCPCCGSDKLSHLPPVITEAVEKIPARIKVIQTALCPNRGSKSAFRHVLCRSA
jgi:hypothetical protein